MNQQELKKEYVFYLHEHNMMHLECVALFEMVEHFYRLHENEPGVSISANYDMANVNAQLKEIEERKNLAESEDEDERIRKELVAFFIEVRNRDGNEGYWHDLKVADILAYLKKQKEQKPAEKQDYSGLTDLERAIHRGFLSAGVENVPVTIIKETANECKRTQTIANENANAEWSDEDEEVMEDLYNFVISDFIQDHIHETRWKPWKTTLERNRQNRLKSLRPQPKQEWSVEDELMIRCCFRAIEHYKYTGKRNVFCPSQFNIDGYLTSPEKVQTWLELLRNRVGKESLQSWKPSEEQMEALKWATECPSAVNHQILANLYNDLQKLM